MRINPKFFLKKIRGIKSSYHRMRFVVVMLRKVRNEKSDAAFARFVNWFGINLLYSRVMPLLKKENQLCLDSSFGDISRWNFSNELRKRREQWISAVGGESEINDYYLAGKVLKVLKKNPRIPTEKLVREFESLWTFFGPRTLSVLYRPLLSRGISHVEKFRKVMGGEYPRFVLGLVVVARSRDGDKFADEIRMELVGKQNLIRSASAA